MLVGILAVHFLLGQSELPIKLHHNFIYCPNHEYQMLCTIQTVEDTFDNVRAK